ncbi:MAG: sigma 54-interacting transcriptional regulator [Pseudomonadota bacterium]
MQEPALLQEFAELVRSVISAPRLSVAFVAEPWDSQRPLLVHTHDPVVPEFEDERCAQAFIARSNPGVAMLRSGNGQGLFARFALSEILPRASAAGAPQHERRAQPDITLAPDVDGYVWFAVEDRDLHDAIMRMHADIAGALEASPVAQMARLLVRLAWNVYHHGRSLNDPTSHLPGRMELQVYLNRAMAIAADEAQAMSVVLINPDDFSMVNHRYGRNAGDDAIREMAGVLVRSLRRTDGIFRYSGAVFAAVLPATDLQQCQQACDKVVDELIGRYFIADRERFTFSVGAITASAADLVAPDFDSTIFLSRADVALNRAKVMGGAITICAAVDDSSIDDRDINPLSGIFTADSEKDYRNMALLWESVTTITEYGDPADIASALVDRLGWHLHPDRIALFDVNEGRDAVAKQIASNTRDHEQPQERLNGSVLRLESRAQKLLGKAVSTQRMQQLADENTGYSAYAIPLLVGGSAVACLLLDSETHQLKLDRSDLTFVDALVTQFAIALDRARLASEWIMQKERESQVLRAELSELRQRVDAPLMLYESAEMRALFDKVQTVAPSEATVLITGESGTGKELVAHAVHDLSDRADQPFVIFDCAAVATNLIEAELFGHVKGAFTGAEKQSPGRIFQADGGTLFLDEIGELPLDVQTKLLRFVQERTYAPVGSNTDRQVDVRIVAATNRQLQTEVSLGRFRQDLYYRLQVISLQIPPLRERVADILPLAEMFLERFASQNRRGELAMDESARQKLLSHSWPGNVRELQHLMLRTVLTTEGSCSHADLEFMPEAPTQPASAVEPAPLVASVEATEPRADEPVCPSVEDVSAKSHLSPWRQFCTAIRGQISSALEHGQAQPVPLGRWLTEDLVLAANRLSGEVAKHGADLLGLPESTFRRHLKKAVAEQDAGLTRRTDKWVVMNPLIEDLVKAEGATGQGCLVERVRWELLREVAQRLPSEIGRAAALMGVTPITYKRWLAAGETG